MIRTRFAPSPTGYLHIGGARTALFSWAFAKKFGGKFILRIEDTDLDRSTPESVQAILDGMKWLKLDYDEGPIYQMQRLSRYREIAGQLLHEGKAYYCYASKEELEDMREVQRAKGEKPRYDGRWRDCSLTPPEGVRPVVRFKNPTGGEVVIDDLVKGRIAVHNSELDDLVIMRADGTPTYNFGVVIDDMDMGITHVIRGDDHVNNTPRQINILKAMGAPLPIYAHLPMILGEDGERLSKRHGAVSVMQYFENGYLPEALLNYLSRLGWSHGDDEVFDMEQFVKWFDLDKISKSAAQFNPEKLLWINQQHIKNADNGRLADLAKPFLEQDECNPDQGPSLEAVCGLLKERVNTIAELADAAVYFYRRLAPSPELATQHFSPETKPLFDELLERYSEIEWTRETLAQTLKTFAAEKGLKLGKIAMPLRVMVTGETHTPPIDAVLELIGRDESLARMRSQLARF
ncbi:MAG: glutamate--tRNA ligase [Burkholderiales bacterium]|nr:glutamate--tRNA ligase [Burkholderiales bacterium]